MWRTLIYVVLLAVPAASVQAASTPTSITTEFNLTGRGGPDTFAVSTLDCGIATCRFEYSVSASLIDFWFVSFHWDVGLTFGKFKGWLFSFLGDSIETTWRTTSVLSNPVAVPGQIDFFIDSPFGTHLTGQAYHHRPSFGPTVAVPLTSEDEEVTLTGSVERTDADPPAQLIAESDLGEAAAANGIPPPDIEYSSNARRLQSGDILLSYLIVNNTSAVVNAMWPSAGLIGDIAPGQTLSREFETAREAVQILDTLTLGFGTPGADMEGPVYTLVAATVPLPASAMFLLGALVPLAGARRTLA